MSFFVADLHIHSRFSLATSKALNLPHLAGWAACKGIHVLGTGDFTHPKWRKELREDLDLDEESGFYRLKKEPQDVLPGATRLPPECHEAPLFCLQTEISSIYKKNGRVRKIHNVVLMPTLDDVDRFSARLAEIGNIESDGRPILGLDAHHLLELVLETSDRAVLIPAHIWTPWFSLFGSNSGFDAIEDCFGDLTGHIFALETGLSSDPAMNRLVSALDGYALVSNSDAHSGPNLGRESNLFLGKPSYDGMIDALKCQARREPEAASLGCRFDGTLEIYPEEGKYHLDGHRDCKVVMTPEETQRHGGICPVCGKKLTIGVLHRVWELADRREVPTLKNEQAVHPVIPLPTVIAEIIGKTTTCKKVHDLYRSSLQRLGSEFSILNHLPIEAICRHSEPLGEAVRRLRAGEIERRGGYDGEYGTVCIFTEAERKELLTAGSFGRLGSVITQKSDKPTVSQGSLLATFKEEAAKAKAQEKAKKPSHAEGLSPEQAEAIAHRGEPLLVLAGPGAGKTFLLTRRLASLAQTAGPAECMALTFSNRAAGEMTERLSRVLPAEIPAPFCGTIHSFAWKLFQRAHEDAVLVPETSAAVMLKKAIEEVFPGMGKADVKKTAQLFSRARETMQAPQSIAYPDVRAAYESFVF